MISFLVCMCSVLPPATAQAQTSSRKFNLEGRFMTWADAARQATAGAPPHLVSDVHVRRARLVVQAQVTDRISLGLQLGQDNIGARSLTPDSGVSIKDAYASLRASTAVQLVVGQFKVPFLRSNLESGFNQLLVDRGTLPGFRPAREGSRDVGAMAWGNAGGWQYRAAVFDGSDQDVAVTGGSLRLTGRLSHNWLSRETGFGYSGTTIGASRVVQVGIQADVQQSRQDPRDDAPFRALLRDYSAYAVDAFVDLPVGRWALTGESAWLHRDDDYRDSVTPIRSLEGHYLQGGVLLPQAAGGARLQFAVRHEAWDTERGAVSTENRRTTAGGTYYLRGHARKVQADYTVKRESIEVANDEFRLSLVLVF